MSLFEPIFAALNAAGARYVVVGGLATVLHGFPHLTADLDLAVDLDPTEARKTLAALLGLGLRPRAPVDPMDFADDSIRRKWALEKGMRVFSFWDPVTPMREVDLFIADAIPFGELWARSETVPLATTSVRIASLGDLITLKRLAGRPQDQQDIEALEAIASQKQKQK